MLGILLERLESDKKTRKEKMIMVLITVRSTVQAALIFNLRMGFLSSYERAKNLKNSELLFLLTLLKTEARKKIE